MIGTILKFFSNFCDISNSFIPFGRVKTTMNYSYNIVGYRTTHSNDGIDDFEIRTSRFSRIKITEIF